MFSIWNNVVNQNPVAVIVETFVFTSLCIFYIKYFRTKRKIRVGTAHDTQIDTKYYELTDRIIQEEYEALAALDEKIADDID